MKRHRKANPTDQGNDHCSRPENACRQKVFNATAEISSNSQGDKNWGMVFAASVNKYTCLASNDMISDATKIQRPAVKAK